MRVKASTNSNNNQDYMEKEVGRLLFLYVDDQLSDDIKLGEARKKAFGILSKEDIF